MVTARGASVILSAAKDLGRMNARARSFAALRMTCTLPGRKRLPITVRRWSVALLLSIQALLVGWIGCRACPNKTELGHMAAAVYFWHTLRFDVFHVNPPLTRIITALPAAMCSPTYDWDFYSSRPQDRSEWRMGSAFIDANSREKIRWCFTLARWSLIPLLLLGGYFGYGLSRDIYGDCAGFVFLALWGSSPLLLAWGATVCPDAVAAALGLVALYTFRHWLYKPNWTRAALAGVCLGFLPLTKLTWIIAFAVWPLIWCFWTIPTLLKRHDGDVCRCPSSAVGGNPVPWPLRAQHGLSVRRNVSPPRPVCCS